MNLTIYGIKNCDTVKRARKWLAAEGIDHTYHDFRTDGLTEEMVEAFVEALGLEAVLNKRGTTWRKLPNDITESLSPCGAKALLLVNDALIKRPVWKKDGEYRLGFAAKDEADLAAWLKG